MAEPVLAPPPCTSWCNVAHCGPGGWDTGTGQTKTCAHQIRDSDDLDVRLERFADVEHGDSLPPVVRIVADVLLTPVAATRLLVDIAGVLLPAGVVPCTVGRGAERGANFRTDPD